MEQIVNKCLDKDKEYRYQRIDDLLIDLRRVKRETSGVSVVSGGLKRTTTQIRLDKRRKEKKKYRLVECWCFIICSCCLCNNIFGLLRSGVQLNPNRVMRTLNLPFKQIMYPSISADGNWIAFPAVDVDGNWNIYLSHSSSGEAPDSLLKRRGS